MIYHVVPWLAGDIGGGLNATIGCLPDDAWICVRDGDTMFLSSRWGEEIEQIVAANHRYELIGCMTNRLRAPYQLHGGVLSDEPDIGKHLQIAQERWTTHGTQVAPLRAGPIAGMLMLFPKRVWERHQFVQRSIYFDQDFTASVRAHGGRVGVALGLYLFHLYRWGKANPQDYKGHLV